MVIQEARKHNLRVIPWFEFGFSSSHSKNGGHIIEAKPEWAAKDSSGQLLTKNGFEWMNAIHPEVQDRLPAMPSEGGYSDFTRQLYSDETGNQVPANPSEENFLNWKADKLSDFAERLYSDVKKVNPDLTVSFSPSIYPWSKQEYLQDWPAWIENGHADWVHPQVYRRQLNRYEQALTAQQPRRLELDDTVRARMYPGVLMQVGDYRISAEDLEAVVAENRAQGFQGEVFFFYEGLRANGGALADRLLDTHYAEPAQLPFERASVP